MTKNVEKSEKETVKSRIEKVRTVLDKRGVRPKENASEAQASQWPDWNDWNNWTNW